MSLLTRDRSRTRLEAVTLPKVRDRREERRRRRSKGAQPTTVSYGVGEVDHAKRVLETLAESNEYRSRQPTMLPGIADFDRLPALHAFASAACDGRLRLDTDHFFGARAGVGTPLRGAAWRSSSSQAVHSEMTTLLDEGNVLVFRCVRDAFEVVRGLADHLAVDRQARVDVNAYVSSTSDQGFSVHNDDHDVIVLQCRGQREWTLTDGGRPNPLRRDVVCFEDPPTGDATTISLRPGDVLYVPRGTWHVVDKATPIDGEPSIHLSFGVYAPTGLDLLDLVIARMLANSLTRSDLACRDEHHNRQLVEHVAAQLEATATELRTASLRSLEAEVRSLALPSLGDVTSVSFEDLEPGLSVRTRCPQAIDMFDESESQAAFYAFEHRWCVPADLATAAHRLLNAWHDPVPLDSLTGDERALVAELQDHGLVAVERL